MKGFPVRVRRRALRSSCKSGYLGFCDPDEVQLASSASAARSGTRSTGSRTAVLEEARRGTLAGI